MIAVLTLCAAGVLSCGETPPVASTPTETTASEFTTSAENTTEETTYPPATVPGHSTAATETQATRPPFTPSDKMIALTFDDGPSVSITPQILDLLEEYEARATFFVLGSNLSESKVISLHRMVALGCEIGNHSESHTNLTALSTDELLREINDTNEKIRRYSGCEQMPTLLRPPGGNLSIDVLQTLYDGGIRMRAILWSDDTRDWEFNSKWKSGEMSREEAIEKTIALALSEAKNGGIVLMHDIKEITPAVLRGVLDALSAEGYSFVTVSELFNDRPITENDCFSKFYERDRVVSLR